MDNKDQFERIYNLIEGLYTHITAQFTELKTEMDELKTDVAELKTIAAKGTATIDRMNDTICNHDMDIRLLKKAIV
ncbi:MAG TPA: hypothetical protein DDZ66_01430 [Firmicutes bacterium]|jgi:uncharacterized coiled-coil DUF342 family protein|nr:hypothetical protein [Bacillota bacterium]